LQSLKDNSCSSHPVLEVPGYYGRHAHLRFFGNASSGVLMCVEFRANRELLKDENAGISRSGAETDLWG
jgi:hypothetical protein